MESGEAFPRSVVTVTARMLQIYVPGFMQGAFYLGMRWLFLQRALQLGKHFHIHEPTEHSVTTTRSKVTTDGEPPSANGLREAGPGGA